MLTDYLPGKYLFIVRRVEKIVRDLYTKSEQPFKECIANFVPNRRL